MQNSPVMVGLATTFGVLAKTDNQSAVRILLPALDSSNPTIQEGALTALLSRSNPSGQDEIIRRVPHLSERWKYIIHQHSGCLTAAMREAMLVSDDTQYANACTAAVMFGDFNLIPTLLIILEDRHQSKADRAADSMMQLTSQLYDLLARGDESSPRRDPQWFQQHMLSSLETSVERFGKHRRQEVIEAFLMLAKSDNALINLILKNPHHVSYLVLIDVLSRSPHEGIMRLLLDFFDDPQALPQCWAWPPIAAI